MTDSNKNDITDNEQPTEVTQKPSPPIEPAPWAQGPIAQVSTTPWWMEPKAIVPFILLIVLLVLVIFWLPSLVTPSKPVASDNSAPPANTSQSAAANAAAGGNLESPWSEAQLAKQRREAQDILAKILDHQRKLEQAQVTSWANEEFSNAMATAASGDEQYRNREFEQAKTLYKQSLEAFTALSEKKDSVFQETLAEGIAALENNDPKISVEKLSLATQIDPSSTQAKQALARANNLEEVLDLVKVSDQLQEQRQWQDALKKLKEAQALDSQSKLVDEKIKALTVTIVDQRFAETMSRGYNALDDGDFRGAREEFKAALAIKPNASDAQAAKTQAENRLLQTALSQQLTIAETLAEQENWEDSLAAYENALKYDPNLVNARIGKIKASTRLKLDENLNALIADPLRIADPQVLTQAQKTLTDAKNISAPGPRLAQQIAKLENAIDSAQTPVTVSIQSNNQTEVTVYRVGKLGVFEEHSLQLKPGRYTVVGSRAGYRDVRQEFTVTADKSPISIRIQCEEKIASL
ncbi:hypothetical protein MAH1_11620 [Sessilibacter sp. MAH1]